MNVTQVLAALALVIARQAAEMDAYQSTTQAELLTMQAENERLAGLLTEHGINVDSPPSA